MTRITGTSHEDLCTFVISSLVIILIKINASDKSSRENQNVRFTVNKFFPKIVTFVRQFGKDGRAREATDETTGPSKKMDGILNSYNLKSTRRIYTFGILKCSEKFKVSDVPKYISICVTFVALETSKPNSMSCHVF